MNPLEQELLKFEKKGFTKDHKKTLKSGLRTFLVLKKGIFGFDEGIYIYYVEGNATTENMRECLKDFDKFRNDDPYETKGIFLCSGTCDQKLFRDLRKAIIRDKEIAASIKLKALGKKDKSTQKSENVKEENPKRVKLTAKERLYVWEHPEKYGRDCNICSGKILKLSDLELDHTIPFSKGGMKMALAHRDCNRMKGSKNLKHIQTKMKFKTTK